MGEWFREQALAGGLGVAIPVAMIAGLVSFFSPCVLPLLPGYLSYATGLSGADLAAGEASRRRGRMLLGSVLFVLGFAVVFVFAGTAFGGLAAAHYLNSVHALRALWTLHARHIGSSRCVCKPID